MNERTLTHLDLFSGIGGFSLGLEAAGFRTIGFSEINSYACRVLKKHWPKIQNFGDVRNIPAGISCDVLTGGFPCQPFSVAGKQRGSSDDRYLWPAMLAVVRQCNPSWIICENVIGIIEMALEQVLTDLADLSYECQPFIIPASGLMAVHKRQRVWIVANRDKNKRNGHRDRSIPAEEGRQMVSENLETRKNRLPELRSTLPSVGRYTYAEARRKFYGIPQGVDRLEALGNAIVPQIAQIIGSAINQIEQGQIE